MKSVYPYLLDALRCVLQGDGVSWATPPGREEWGSLRRMAEQHSVLPLVADALWRGGQLTEESMIRRARNLTIRQAGRTAEFLLLYDALAGQGLHPVVLKGIVCRSLYPHPEQRPSVDEDLLIPPEEFSRYHRALLAYGLTLMDPSRPLEHADEVSYVDRTRHLYLELHMSPFPPDSRAYGDCNALFTGVLDRAVAVQIEDVTVRTLAPTDHLLYLICHAYKHFLHSGVGIRQVCDIAMFTRAYGDKVDWGRILAACRSIRIEVFAAAIFRITERHLGFAIPEAFAGIAVDETDLLEDMLSGGVYGTADEDRLHSSTMTLDAVAADKAGRKSGNLLHSVFLPLGSLQGRYPYLRRWPVLLPVAWAQRVLGYAAKRKKVDPSRTVRIGRDRIQLLRQYHIID